MPHILTQPYSHMIQTLGKIFTLLLLASSLFSLSACGGNNVDETDRWDEAELYREAKAAMKRGEFQRAVKRLETLEARYPFGDYALQGQLDLIYAYQRSGVPDDALAAARRFLRLNPTHPRADYAWYMQGVAEFERHRSLLGKWFPRDPGKYDSRVLEKSYNAFYQLTTRYPASPYAADARQRMIYLKNKLAEACIDTAQWYQRRKAYLAAAKRAQQCIERYDGALATEQALPIINRNYRKLGLNDLLIGE